jgi:adenylate cyclase
LCSALRIQERLTDVNITWRTALDFLVMFDIGIATGEVLSGNVGHPDKIQHTVIGRQVHLAAELAKLCRTYNVEILTDVATFDEAKESVQFRELGEKLILAYPEPVALFTPVTGS